MEHWPNEYSGGDILRVLRTQGVHRETGRRITQGQVQFVSQELGPSRGLAGISEGNLTKYENDKLKPTAEVLSLIIDSLDTLRTERVRATDIHALYRRFDRELFKRLPKETEKEWARSQVRDLILSSEDPVYLVDNTILALETNSAFLRLAGIDGDQVMIDRFFKTPIYRALYDEKLRFIDKMVNPDAFLPIATAVLRLEIQRSGNKEWFEYEDLLETEESFRRHWEQAFSGNIAALQSNVPLQVLLSNGEVRHYRIIPEEFHTDSRFRVIRYVPVPGA